MRLVVLALLAALGGGTACAEATPARGTAPGKPDAAVAELKPKLRALLVETLKANDVWTALQVEAYSQKLGIRSSPILGSSEIVGDPLFAYPQHVVGLFDRGDQVVVVAGGRCYQAAPDGRPLAMAINLELAPNSCALSLDGKVLAAVERRRRAPVAMAFTVRALPAGSELFKASMPHTAGDYVTQTCVAEDGSAALACVFDSDDASPRLFVARANGTNNVVPGYFRPLGIGPAGAWALAEPWATRRDDQRHYALLTIAGIKPFISAAMGPGIAVAISSELPPPPVAAPAATPPTAAAKPAAPAVPAAAPAADATDPPPPPQPELKLHLIKSDGALVDLAPAVGLGKGARVHTVGRWLVLGSGRGGQAPPQLDLLGNEIKSDRRPQGTTTSFFRWSDLLADPAAPPAFQVEGGFAVAAGEAAAVYVWHDQAITLVDLAGAQAVPRPFAEAGFPVETVISEANLVKACNDDEDQWLVSDLAGHQLWTGAADACALFEPGWAVVHQGGAKPADGSYQLIGLNADAAKRSVVKLQLDASRWEVTVDRFGRRALASGTGSKWVDLDLATGKARRSGATAPVPAAVTREQPPGRYRIEFARLVEKALPALDDPLATWCPKDAWRVGSAMVVLDHYDRVLVPTKRRGFASIGFCEGGSHFGMSRVDLVVADENEHVIAGFAPGPALVQEFAGKGTTVADPLPPGPWRVAGMDYVCPHAGPLQWDAAKAGFAPRALRSTPGSQGDLLVITDSLIFAMDAPTAKQMGSLVKGP